VNDITLSFIYEIDQVKNCHYMDGG